MEPVARRFLQVFPRLQDGSPQPTGTIENFFHHRVFVVLGEPGLGKTSSFEYAAKQEKDAEFVRIGVFLSAASLDHWKGKTLYLDGLDEHRSRANGMDVMDAIVGRLREIECPPVRISCRTAEWHGGKDLNALSAISEGTPVIQVELQPLTDLDILKLVPDSEDFVEKARQHELDGFLHNPQDFLLLYEFYSEKGEWPDNRSELMEGACNALLKETNEVHSETVDDWVTDSELERASNHLACILMLSNIEGISSKRANSARLYPSIQAFGGNLHALKAATGRRVFNSVGNNRVEAKHRKIAEYMGARYLAARVREGLPLRRVMALMTGIDGGTPPDLRGIYAWLVTLLSGMADHVLVHDPYGAIIYGDSYAWTPRTKSSALAALRNMAQKDPWFRAQDWSRHALGGLSHPALVEDFKSLLIEDTCDSHIVSVILDAIAGGSRFPEIGDPLLDFIRNPNKPDHLKDDAIDAFVTSCPDRTEDLVKMLDDVHAGEIKDEDRYLRGSLLRNLYPATIGPENVVHYLIEPSDGVIGWYHVFLRSRIFELTDKDGLVAIANSIHQRDLELGEDEYDESPFITKLICRLINEVGGEASVDQLSSWFSMGLGKHGSSRIRGEDSKAIRIFLESNSQVYISLFFNFFDKHWHEFNEWHQIWWRFKEFVVHVAPPHEFLNELLRIIREEEDVEKSKILFGLLCFLFMNEEPRLSSITIEELWEAAENRQEFDRIIDAAAICTIDEWRQEGAERRQQRLEEKELRQARNIEDLNQYRAAIESGDAAGILDHYAKVWFGLFADVDSDASPIDRLRQEVGNELADRIVEGFLQGLHKPYFNTLQDIAKTDSKQRTYNRGYLMLAALDVVSMRGRADVLNLPDNILRLALAYEMAANLSWGAEWPSWLLADKSELVVEVLREYWRVQLGARAERLTNFYAFSEDEPRLSVVARILGDLLGEYPRAHPRVLEDMLVNAVRYCRKDEIVLLVTNALKRRFHGDTGQRMMWIAAGFVSAEGKYLRQLETRLRKHEKDKWAVRPILLASLRRRGDDEALDVTLSYRKQVVEILGSVFNNVHFETKGGARFISDQDEPTVANEVRTLIHAFGQEASDQAAISLAELARNPALSHWYTDILYASANQIRTAREAKFTYPNVSQVVSTLSNAEPANVVDLKALVLDALQEVAGEIRHGNTDGYKAFWNIGKYGKPTATHVDENTARNRLLDLLRPKLRHLDIAAEPCIAPGSLDTSLSHAAGLSDIAVCHA